jgi:hypothetical protein
VYSLPEKDWSSSRLNKLEKVRARERELEALRISMNGGIQKQMCLESAWFAMPY